MILTVKPDKIQAGKIRRLMKYTDEATATKAVLFAAVRYQNRLTDIEKLEKELVETRSLLGNLHAQIANRFRLEDDIKSNRVDIEKLVERFPKYGLRG